MTQATMHVKERSEAIQRAQRALKPLGEHPRWNKKKLGHALEHVNARYSHASGEHVWNAVAQVEAMAEQPLRRAPSPEEQRQPIEAADDLEAIARQRHAAEQLTTAQTFDGYCEPLGAQALASRGRRGPDRCAREQVREP